MGEGRGEVRCTANGRCGTACWAPALSGVRPIRGTERRQIVARTESKTEKALEKKKARWVRARGHEHIE